MARSVPEAASQEFLQSTDNLLHLIYALRNGSGESRGAMNHRVPPGIIGVKQYIGEGCNFADGPREGHPNGYRQREG